MKKREVNMINEALKMRSDSVKQESKKIVVSETPKPKVGDSIWFSSEKRPYKVRACDDRFVICTKPFNCRKTVLYTIIDLKEGVRGTENLIFCEGFETDELCHAALLRLQSDETEVSHRNRVRLDIVRIVNQTKTTK